MYVRRLAMGRPMGTLSRPSSTHVQWVTSMAASVGPYKLYSAAVGSVRNVCRCRAIGSASPLHTMRRKETHRAASSVPIKACSMDGTKCSVVIACSTISAANCCGSR